MATLSASVQTDINSDKTVGIIIGVVIALIIILLIIVVIFSDKSSGGTKTKLTVQTTAPPVTKQPPPQQVQVAPMPRPPAIPELINRIMRTRRMHAQAPRQMMINPAHNHYMAAQILNTLQFANHIGDLTDRRLPVVIDLAVAVDGPLDQKLQEVLFESANQTRDKIIGNRRAIARAEPTPAARMDKYIELSTSHSDDPQSSHDTYVNKCLRNIIKILREDQKEEALLPIFQIRCEIQRKFNVIPPKENEQSLDTPKEQSVLTIIDIMDGKGPSQYNPALEATIRNVLDGNGGSQYNSTLEATEAEILQRVWMRSLDKRNAAVKDEFQEMIYTSLASCFEGGSIVCINGRCAKILSAPVKLDFDPRLHELQTLESHKNNIFIKTRELVKKRCEKMLQSSDEKVRTVAQSFLAEKAEDLPKDVDPEKNKEITIYLRKCVSDMVREMSQGLPNEIVNHIINEAAGAI